MNNKEEEEDSFSHFTQRNLITYRIKDYHYGRKYIPLFSTLPPTDLSVFVGKEKMYYQHTILTVSKNVLPLKSLYSDINLVIKKLPNAIMKIEFGIRIKWSKDKGIDTDVVNSRKHLNKSYVLTRKQVTIGPGQGYHSIQDILSHKIKSWNQNIVKYSKNKSVRVYLSSGLLRKNRISEFGNHNGGSYRINKSYHYNNYNNNRERGIIKSNYRGFNRYNTNQRKPFLLLVTNDELILYIMIKVISSKINKYLVLPEKEDTNTIEFINKKAKTGEEGTHTLITPSSTYSNSLIEDRFKVKNNSKYLSEERKKKLSKNLIHNYEIKEEKEKEGTTVMNTNITLSMLSNIYYRY